MRKTSVLSMSKVWGEGRHKVGRKGKMWIFCTKYIYFFDFWKKIASLFQQAKWPKLGQIWVNFGWKGPFFKFPWKTKAVIFSTLVTRLPAKIMKFQCAVFGKSAKNPHFWDFWAKKANFGSKGPFSNFQWKI